MSVAQTLKIAFLHYSIYLLLTEFGSILVNSGIHPSNARVDFIQYQCSSEELYHIDKGVLATIPEPQELTSPVSNMNSTWG